MQFGSKTDIWGQKLLVTETYTSFSHSNKGLYYLYIYNT